MGFMMSINYLFVMQVATHLKGLADKAKLNEKHVRIARIYKAKVATLTSERSELEKRVQHMSEEMEKLKSDLKHTSSARARAESREAEIRTNLTTVEEELREARSAIRDLQSDCLNFKMGFHVPRVSFNWLERNSLFREASGGNFRRSCVRP